MKRTVLFSLLLGVAIPLMAQAPVSDAPEVAAPKNLNWRSIGPANMGGRVTDIAGIPGDPKIFYVAGADGGIFKTINGGTTFKALFQDQAAAPH